MKKGRQVHVGRGKPGVKSASRGLVRLFCGPGIAAHGEAKEKLIYEPEGPKLGAIRLKGAQAERARVNRKIILPDGLARGGEIKIHFGANPARPMSPGRGAMTRAASPPEIRE
jgi:hypothetical protein